MNERRDLIEGIAEQRKLVAIREGQLKNCKETSSNWKEEDKHTKLLNEAKEELACMIKQYQTRVEIAISKAYKAWNEAMTETLLAERVTIAMADSQEAAWQKLCEVLKEKKEVLLEDVVNTDMIRKEFK